MIRILWSEGVSGATIHQRLSAQYGNSVLPLSSAWKWIEKLKNGRKRVTHEEETGCLHMATNEDNIMRAHYMVLLYTPVIIDEVANCLKISHGSAYKIIHSRHEFRKICVRWAPKLLTMLHKQMRLDICQHHLDHYDNKLDAFLDRIIIVDKTWIHH
jgi:hypothetical protein